jgi:hypothetical protein
MLGELYAYAGAEADCHRGQYQKAKVYESGRKQKDAVAADGHTGCDNQPHEGLIESLFIHRARSHLARTEAEICRVAFRAGQ